MLKECDSKVIDLLREAFELEEAGDIAGSIRMFKAAAKQGSNDARSKLGTIFDDVVHPSKPARAVYWYKQGVKGGDAECAWNLAMHYAGLQRKRGYLYWLLKAEAMGDPDAKAELLTGEWWGRRSKSGGKAGESKAGGSDTVLKVKIR